MVLIRWQKKTKIGGITKDPGKNITLIALHTTIGTGISTREDIPPPKTNILTGGPSTIAPLMMNIIAQGIIVINMIAPPLMMSTTLPNNDIGMITCQTMSIDILAILMKIIVHLMMSIGIEAEAEV